MLRFLAVLHANHLPWGRKISKPALYVLLWPCAHSQQHEKERPCSCFVKRHYIYITQEDLAQKRLSSQQQQVIQNISVNILLNFLTHIFPPPLSINRDFLGISIQMSSTPFLGRHPRLVLGLLKRRWMSPSWETTHACNVSAQFDQLPPPGRWSHESGITAVGSLYSIVWEKAAQPYPLWGVQIEKAVIQIQGHGLGFWHKIKVCLRWNSYPGSSKWKKWGVWFQSPCACAAVCQGKQFIRVLKEEGGQIWCDYRWTADLRESRTTPAVLSGAITKKVKARKGSSPPPTQFSVPWKSSERMQRPRSQSIRWRQI